jgi:hypothetical protein
MDMQALKIVCEHYDTLVIDQAKLTNNYVNIFNEKLNFIIDELEKILWVSQRPYNSEENFYNMYYDCNHISENEKKELWNLCDNIYKKHKVLFESFEEDFGIYNTFLGVVSGIRALNKLNYVCNLTNLDENTDYWKPILNDAEKKSFDPAKIAQDKLIEGTINDIFNLNLYLESSMS